MVGVYIEILLSSYVSIIRGETSCYPLSLAIIMSFI